MTCCTWNRGKGTLVCDDYGGYKALFSNGVVEAGCMAHARRKFFDLHASSKSSIAEEAIRFIGALYAIETQVREVDDETRWRMRQEYARPAAERLHVWLSQQRQRVPDGSATAKAIDYSLNRWQALTRHLDDGAVPIDNNTMENQIRPIALGRKNWMFAGSLRAGKRAAAIMSLNGRYVHAYMKDVLERLPIWPNSHIDELLPHAVLPPNSHNSSLH